MRYAEIIYTDTTSREAVDGYMERQMKQRERKDKWKNCSRKHMAQKFYGVVTIVLTVVAIMQDGDATIAIITLPLGLYLMVSRKMLIGLDSVGEQREDR